MSSSLRLDQYEEHPDYRDARQSPSTSDSPISLTSFPTNSDSQSTDSLSEKIALLNRIKQDQSSGVGAILKSLPENLATAYIAAIPHTLTTVGNLPGSIYSELSGKEAPYHIPDINYLQKMRELEGEGGEVPPFYQKALYELAGPVGIAGKVAKALGKSSELLPYLGKAVTAGTAGSLASASTTPVQDALHTALTTLLTGPLGYVTGSNVARTALGVKNALETALIGKSAEDQASPLADSISRTPQADASSAFQETLKKYKDVRQLEDSKYGQTKAIAREFGQTIPQEDKDKLISSIQQQIDETKQRIATQPLRRHLEQPGLDFLSYVLENAKANNLEGLIDMRPALNDFYRTALDADQPIPKSTISKTLATYHNFMKDYLHKQGLSQLVGEPLEEANALTKHRMDTYETTIDPNQNVKKSVFSKQYALLKQRPSQVDTSKGLQDILENQSIDNLGKMQQLTDMLGGDSSQARSLFRSHYFKPSLTGQKMNIQKFLGLHDELGDLSQQALFSPEEDKRIKILKNIRDISPKLLDSASTADYNRWLTDALTSDTSPSHILQSTYKGAKKVGGAAVKTGIEKYLKQKIDKDPVAYQELLDKVAAGTYRHPDFLNLRSPKIVAPASVAISHYFNQDDNN